MKNNLLPNETESFSRRALFLVLGVWLVFVLFAFSRHEMWRDEVEPWAFCLQHNFSDILSVPTLTGHPPLWYYIVETTTLLGSHPHLMRIPHTIFMLMALWLLLRYASFTKIDKILLVFSYYFLYEYTVLTRNYAPSVFLLLAVAALWRRRQDCFWWMVLLLALAIFTMILNGLIVGFFLLLLWLEARQSFLEKKPAVIPFRRLVSGSLLLILLLAGAVLWSTPKPGSNFSPILTMRILDLSTALYALKTAANAFLPLSKPAVQFWNNSFIENGVILVLVSLFVLAATVFAFRRKPGLMVAYFITASAFVLFFFKVYGGSWRHHGYLWILFIIAGWLYPEIPGTERQHTKAYTVWERYRRGLFRTLCFLQALAVLAPLYYDWRNDFSAGKAAADYLRPQLDEQSLVMCDLDFSAMALAAYLRRPVYFPGLQDTTIWVSYDSPKRDRQAFAHCHDSTYQAMIWNKAVQVAQERHKRVWLVLNYRIDHPMIRMFSKTIVADEKHFLYLVEPKPGGKQPREGYNL